MATDFLDYARPRAAERERVALSTIVQETIVLFMNSREYRQSVAIRSVIDPSIGVMGDPQRMRQVFWNLLINAAQAIRDGGEIRITAEQPGGSVADEVMVSVTDNGSGIDPEEVNKVFDPFFTTKSEGTGLGLSIVYRIVEEHGGTITVSSARDKGPTFLIRLPAASPVGPGLFAKRPSGRGA